MTNQAATESGFDWPIDEVQMWRPRGRPQAPYGPTRLEIIRSCPLRACFETSTGYASRLDPAARVGIAFNHTIESLLDTPPIATKPEAWAEDARRRFLEEFSQQHAQAARQPRERILNWDESRVHAAMETAVAPAMRLSRSGDKPLTGAQFPVPVDPTACQRVADDSASLVRIFEVQHGADVLARYGEVCKVCAFRP